MSISFVIPGADFSGLGNPKVETNIVGMPTRNLKGLYLFEDGAVGSTPTQATDSSGLGNHAPFLTGSNVRKTATGVTSAFTGAYFQGSITNGVLTVDTLIAGTIETGKKLLGSGVTGNPTVGALLSGPGGAGSTYQLNVNLTMASQLFYLDNPGFYAKTPMLYDGSFSVVGITRSSVPNSYGNYPTLHLAAADSSGGGVAMTESFGASLTATAGNLSINNDSTSAGATNLEIGLLNRKTNNANVQWTGANSIRAAKSTSSQPKNSWVAWGLSLNAVTGEVLWRSLSGFTGATTITDLDQVTSWLNGVKANKHLFGFGKYLSGHPMLGDMGFFAHYSAAKTLTELDTVIAAAKARVALRGVTAY